VNGKLQILGIGTALKILFSNDTESLNLQRNEVIALINTLRKLSDSVLTIQRLRTKEIENTKKMILTIAVLIITVLGFFIFSVCCGTRKKKETDQPKFAIF